MMYAGRPRNSPGGQGSALPRLAYENHLGHLIAVRKLTERTGAAGSYPVFDVLLGNSKTYEFTFQPSDFDRAPPPKRSLLALALRDPAAVALRQWNGKVLQWDGSVEVHARVRVHGTARVVPTPTDTAHAPRAHRISLARISLARRTSRGRPSARASRPTTTRASAPTTSQSRSATRLSPRSPSSSG